MSKEVLSKKILNEEGLEGLVLDWRFSEPLSGRKMGPKSTKLDMPWWLRREYLRMQYEVYPPATALLKWLNMENYQLAVHVSKDDPKMIAYTPDRQSGESDRQVRTTIGKLLTKLYPVYPDTAIAALTKEHFAELCDEFIELTDIKDILAVYASGEGGGACMSKPDEAYPYGRPVAAYEAPHISMAVLKDDNGRVTARTMLYCPTPEDKRYIRVFGDQLLARRLEKRGYKTGSWTGAEFKLIQPMADHVLMPYLDSNGARGGETGSSVAIFDGKLRSIDMKTRKALLSLGAKYVATCTHQTGAIQLKAVDSSLLEVRCAWTGKMFNTLTHEFTEVWVDGAFYKASLETATEAYAEGLLRLAYPQATGALAYVPAEVETYIHDRSMFVESEENREEHGYTKLALAHYPEKQEWVQAHIYGRLREIYKATAEGTILSEDAVELAEPSRRKYVHRDTITKGWVRVHSRKTGVLCYAPPDIRVVKTLSGRKVVVGYHDVVKLFDGGYEFSRNVQSVHMFGESYNFSNKCANIASRTRPGGDVHRAAVKRYIAERSRNPYEAILLQYFRDYHSAYDIVAGKSLRSWQMEGQAPTLEQFEGSGLATYTEAADLFREVRILKAEAEALDYTAGQLPYEVPAEMRANFVGPKQGVTTELPVSDDIDVEVLEDVVAYMASVLPAPPSNTDYYNPTWTPTTAGAVLTTATTSSTTVPPYPQV
jgi:hypothetical protein